VFLKTSPKSKGDDGVYHPGMLKVSPNSGFTQFKKPEKIIDDLKAGNGSQET